jgi:hypothetical protein
VVNVADIIEEKIADARRRDVWQICVLVCSAVGDRDAASGVCLLREARAIVAARMPAVASRMVL